MMAKMPDLLLDGPPAMTIDAADLTLGDLALEGGNRVLPLGELDNVGPFHPHVVEFEDH